MSGLCQKEKRCYGQTGEIRLSTTQPLAIDVRGVIVPLSGHWIPEEQPEFVIDQLSSFFGDSTNGTGDTEDTEDIGGIFDLS